MDLNLDPKTMILTAAAVLLVVFVVRFAVGLNRLERKVDAQEKRDERE